MAGNSAPLQLFGDFGFVGGEDTAPNPLQNAQTCINWYAEVDKQNAKDVVGLLACPGLIQLVAAPGGGVPSGVGAGGGGAGPSSITLTYSTSNTLGFGGYIGTHAPQPIISSIGGGTARIIAAAYGFNGANSTNASLISESTGSVQGSAAFNSFETQVSKSFQNSGITITLPNTHTVGLHPLMFTPAADFWIGAGTNGNSLIVGHASDSTSACAVCVSMTSGGVCTFASDVIAALSVPAGTGWTFMSCIPGEDGQHFIIITKTTAGTFAHLCKVVSGAVSELSVYSNPSTTITLAAANVFGFYQSYGMSGDQGWLGMLQANLLAFWIYNPWVDNSTYQVERWLLSGTSLSQLAMLYSTMSSYSVPNGATSRTEGNNFMAATGAWVMLFTGSAIPTAPTTWPLPSSIVNLPVRGLWELPNDNTALAVIGNTCYLVTVATPAIGYPPTFPTLALTSVGTLLTNTGPVSIRDNDVGGFAVIVDGPYGYTYNIATQTFAQITDPAFLGADTVAFIDGWWIFNQPGTQTFYTNFPQYSTAFNGAYFALKDGAADNLRAVFENKEQLWLVGDKTTEVWYDAGGQYFAFQRLVGTLMQFGCKAAHSVCRFSSEGQDGVILFGRSERGENVIIKTRGFSFDVVSTPAFSKEVASYPITSDAIAYTYQEDTHEFYVLTFPTADVTWCYDAQSGLLHKRLSYDPYLQKFHRHRSNCFMNFQGMRIVGDYQCGSLFQLTRTVQNDAGWPLRALRRSPHIWDKGQRGRVFMASLQTDFRPGVGNPSGLGSDPQANLRISRDGGATFGITESRPIGKIGQYTNRTMWRKLAFARDSVVELEVIDPVPRDIIGVTLRAFSA